MDPKRPPAPRTSLYICTGGLCPPSLLLEYAYHIFAVILYLHLYYIFKKVSVLISVDIKAVSKTIRITVGVGKRHTWKYEVLKGLTTSFEDIEHEIDAKLVSMVRYISS